MLITAPPSQRRRRLFTQGVVAQLLPKNREQTPMPQASGRSMRSLHQVESLAEEINHALKAINCSMEILDLQDPESKKFYEKLIELRKQYLKDPKEMKACAKQGFLEPLSYVNKFGEKILRPNDMEVYAKSNSNKLAPCAVILDKEKKVIAYSLFISPLNVFRKYQHCPGMREIVKAHDDLVKKELLPNDSTLKNTWFIDEVCVDENYRGNKLAEHLIKAQLDYIRNQGQECKYLMLDHHINNQASEKTFTKQGFNLIPTDAPEAQFTYLGQPHVLRVKKLN